jgi:dihydroorotase
MKSPQRLYKNGLVARSDSRELLSSDVLVDGDGRIAAVGPHLKADPNTEVIDCTGCVLVPGMFDLHVHAREPGGEHKETLATCAAAALHGGVTGLVLMPDTTPPIDTGHLVKSVQDLADDITGITMLPAGCLTKGRAGTELASFSGMVSRGVPLLTDADRTVPCPAVMRRCLEYARDFDVLVATHGDTPALSRGGAMNEGRTSYSLGLPGNPAISQEIAIDRDLRLAALTGARLHLQQISTAAGARAVSRAKEDGLAISAEVSAHHLVLDETDIGDYQSHAKTDPPLRLAADKKALLARLLDGTIDLIASDHSPHTEFEKSSDFASAPAGFSGLETTVLVLFDQFIKSGRFGWDLLIQKYADAPRALIGLPKVPISVGARAEFFIFDPAARTAVEKSWFRSRSPVNPFIGRDFAGAVRETVVG